MDLRQYDPAIARWTAIDPVTHHSMSTYNAFDNNPVFWSDPSGANSDEDIRNAKANKPDWDHTISSNADGGNNGNNGCPSGCDGVANPNNPIELDEVVINSGGGNGNSGGRSWTSEVTDRYAYSGSFAQWHSQNSQFSSNPSLAYDQWDVAYGDQHTVFADAMDRARNAENAMAHLRVWHTFFYQAEEVFYVLPGSAFGSLARGSGRVFGFKGILPDRFTAFRNFGNNELAAFQKAGNKFSFGKNFKEKQFWLDQKGLDFWKNSSFAKPNTIKISLPQSHMRYYRLLDGHNALSYGPNDLQALNNAFKIIK